MPPRSHLRSLRSFLSLRPLPLPPPPRCWNFWLLRLLRYRHSHLPTVIARDLRWDGADVHKVYWWRLTDLLWLVDSSLWIASSCGFFMPVVVTKLCSKQQRWQNPGVFQVILFQCFINDQLGVLPRWLNWDNVWDKEADQILPSTFRAGNGIRRLYIQFEIRDRNKLVP